MEPRFGHDFSRVRVHTNAAATHGASAIGAKAFTIGDNIVFGAGEYAPLVKSGRLLLAHELAHVVQQSQIDRPGKVFRKENNESSLLMTGPEEGDESQLEDLLTQITERTTNNLELKVELDSLPEASSQEREVLSAALKTGHMDLIGLLQRRMILLQIAIARLGNQLTSTPMTSGAEGPTAERVFFQLHRYNRQLKQHQDQLKPLLRWQTRQKIDSLTTEIAMIDEELADLPPVSDPEAPEAELLATRRSELAEQRKTLVRSLVSSAVEFKQAGGSIIGGVPKPEPDPKKSWGIKQYGRSKDCTNIATGGCGPTSLAILLNYLYGQDPEALTTDDIYFVTPVQTADYAATHGRICNSGTNAQTMVTQVSTQWPGYRGKSIKLEQAIAELAGGNLVIFSCRGCTGKNASGKDETYGAHILVLSGVDDAGKTFNVLDPGRREETNIETITKTQLSTKAGGFWIVEKK
jgi:hypothetical protein